MTKRYKIEIKRDFGPHGYYDSMTRSNKTLGFIVTDGFCNIIPGACWFKTIEQAMTGIQAHMNVGDCKAWHDEYKRIGGHSV